MFPHVMIRIDDFDKCCRCCLSTSGSMQPLFGLSLGNMLQEIVPIPIYENDGYPQLVCIQCVLKLSGLFTFRRLVLRNHDILSNVIKAGVCKDQINSKNNLINDIVNIESVDNDAISKKNNEIGEKDLESIHSRVLENKKSFIDNNKVMTKGNKEADCSIYGNKVLEHEETEYNYCSITSEIIQQISNEKSVEREIMESEKEIEIQHNINAYSDTELFDDDLDTPLEGFIEKEELVVTHIDKLVKCAHCPNYFENKNDLKDHIKVHEEECKVCNKIISKASKWRHMRTHSEVKHYQCKVCKRRFTDKSNMIVHMKIHRGEPRLNLGYLCNLCGKKFKWKTSLYKHLRSHQRKFHVCQICGKEFSEMSHLKIHMLKHTEPNHFKCEVCGTTFSQQSSLKKHKAVHLPTRRRFNCNTCYRSYLHKFSLLHHERNKHANVEILHECSECGKVFNSIKSLKNHLRLHGAPREEIKSTKGRKNMNKTEIITNREPAEYST